MGPGEINQQDRELKFNSQSICKQPMYHNEKTNILFQTLKKAIPLYRVYLKFT